MSDPPPGEKGTTNRTGFVGYAAGCAACAHAADRPARQQHRRLGTRVNLFAIRNYFNAGSGGGVPSGSGWRSTLSTIDTSV